MTGNAVIITADGTPIPSSMSCTININQEAVEYTPLPGSVTAEEEGWKHYRRGNYSWSLQNDSFLTDLNVGVAELSGTKPQVGINIGEAAGQSVFHCHMHVIPRYKGDVPNPKGGVRGVIPSKQSYSAKKRPEKPSTSAKKT